MGRGVPWPVLSPGTCHPWGHPLARWGQLSPPGGVPGVPKLCHPSAVTPSAHGCPELGGNAAAWPRPPRSSLAEQLGRASTAPLMVVGWPRPLALIGPRPGRTFPAPLRGRRGLFPQWGGRGQGVPGPGGSDLWAVGDTGAVGPSCSPLGPLTAGIPAVGPIWGTLQISGLRPLPVRRGHWGPWLGRWGGWPCSGTGPPPSCLSMPTHRSRRFHSLLPPAY